MANIFICKDRHKKTLTSNDFLTITAKSKKIFYKKIAEDKTIKDWELANFQSRAYKWFN